MSQVKRWNSMPVSNMAPGQRAVRKCVALFTPQKLKARVCFNSQSPNTDGPPLVFDLMVQNIHNCSQVKGHLCLSEPWSDSASTSPKQTPVVWTDRWALEAEVPTCWCRSLSLGGRFTSPSIIPHCVRWCLLQSLNARQRLPLCIIYWAKWEGAFICSDILKQLPVSLRSDWSEQKWLLPVAL